MRPDIANDAVIADHVCVPEVSAHIPADPGFNATDQFDIVFEIVPTGNDSRIVRAIVDEPGLRCGIEIVPTTVPESFSGLMEPAQVHFSRIHRAQRGYIAEKVSHDLHVLATFGSAVLIEPAKRAVHTDEWVVIGHLGADEMLVHPLMNAKKFLLTR